MDIVPAELLPRPTKKIPGKIKRAIDALIRGDVKTITDAAELVGYTREHLSRELHRPHIQAFFQDKVKRIVTLTSGRAAARLAELIDDPRSAHVSLEASKFALGYVGVRPTSDEHLSVDVNVRAGFVIDLSTPSEPMKIVGGDLPKLPVPRAGESD